MTISAALSSALSGLNASSRMADVVSGNLANMLTEGFAPRGIELIAQQNGRGVAVAGIYRKVDEALLSDRRLADSSRAEADGRNAFSVELERALGTPGTPGSLTSRIAAFEASLVSAGTRPDEPNRLIAVLQNATSLSDGLNAITRQIDALRSSADSDIARAVESINNDLQQVRTLNIKITELRQRGLEINALEDQRQKVIDDLATFVPLRQLPRANGTVALATTGGALLLDGRVAEIGFTATPIIAPHMRLENGLLSGITINGVSTIIGQGRGPLGGGKLDALFAVRDKMAVQAQENVDALARDVIERFQDAGLDPTVPPGAPGLFTDQGTLFDPSNEIGIAGRIHINSAVDPERGGELFRLRDGLGSLTPGPVGNASLLQSMAGALNDNRVIASGTLGSAQRTTAGHAATLLSIVAQSRLNEEQKLSFSTTQSEALRALELEAGVDSDAELQRLLLVEQAFSANARMIQTIDDMMQTLLRI